MTYSTEEEKNNQKTNEVAAQEQPVHYEEIHEEVHEKASESVHEEAHEAGHEEVAEKAHNSHSRKEPSPSSSLRETQQTIVHSLDTTVRFLKAKRYYVVGMTAFLLVLTGFTVYTFTFANKISPNTFISGIAMGGFTKEEALNLLENREKEFLKRNLVLKNQEKSWEVKPEQLQIDFENAAAVDQAFARGNSGHELQQIGDLLKAAVSKQNFEVKVKPLSDEGKTYLDKNVLKDIESATSETTLKLTPGNVQIVAGKDGERLDYANFESQLSERFNDEKNELTLSLKKFQPEVTQEEAEAGKELASQILAQAWTLNMGDKSFALAPADLVPWLEVQVERNEQQEATGLTLALKDAQVKKDLANYIGQSERKATNARLNFKNGQVTVIADAKTGLKVNEDQTITSIKNTLLAKTGPTDRVIQAVTEVAQPDLTRDNLEQLGIKELIGTATTDFTGSPNNRKFNIGVGSRNLNGGLVKDGQVYSTTTTLGPVDESTGYLPELVIKENRTIPEAGGGLCQVSTTLFRAVLNAGLPVVERTNHSYRVGYYEVGVGPGLDATVYIPNPDFKWKNDTGKAIYIQSYIVDTKLTFELYGTRDGRTSSISKPVMLEESPPGNPIYSETDTLFIGETKQIEKPHPGAKTSVTYVVSRGGKEINRQIFRSTYRPWPAQYLVGTKERPAGEATPTPSPSPTP